MAATPKELNTLKKKYEKSVVNYRSAQRLMFGSLTAYLTALRGEGEEVVVPESSVQEVMPTAEPEPAVA
jgi:hypothetical protein